MSRLSSVFGMFSGRNRVDSPRMPGVTPNHAPECQPAAPEETVDLEGLGSVSRAAGIKPASGGQQRRNEPLVAQDQQIWHAPHRIPAGAPPWRQWFGSGDKHRLTRLERGSAGLEDANQGSGPLSVTEQVVQFFPDFTGTSPQNIPAGDQDDPQSLYRAGIPGFTSGIPRQPL